MPKVVCGEIHRQACEAIHDANQRRDAGVRISADNYLRAGVILGQTEKCYLGACQACMFRVSPDRQAFASEILGIVCDIYSLGWTVIDTKAGQELWVYRNERARKLLKSLDDVEENSTAWHFIRGQLCGCPEAEIDPHYHLRESWNERCD